MSPDNFIQNYEAALATQDWAIVEPLISNTASVTFSDGSVHVGKERVRKAYEKNFATIKGEKYSMDKVAWLKKEERYAVYQFEFNWTGRINDKFVSGSGVGTAVLIKEAGEWKLLTEHLGRKAE